MPDGGRSDWRDPWTVHDEPPYVAKILAELQALRAEVAALKPKRENGDEALLAALMAALGDNCGSDPFFAADLVDDEAYPMAAGMSALEIGRLIARGADREIAGRRIVRAGKRWRVVAS